jgi:hypothetical protein
MVVAIELSSNSRHHHPATFLLSRISKIRDGDEEWASLAVLVLLTHTAEQPTSSLLEGRLLSRPFFLFSLNRLVSLWVDESKQPFAWKDCAPVDIEGW